MALTFVVVVILGHVCVAWSGGVRCKRVVVVNMREWMGRWLWGGGWCQCVLGGVWRWWISSPVPITVILTMSPCT